MELVHGLHIWRIAGEAFRGHDVLAGIIAFGGTVPEEEAAVEGWLGQINTLEDWNAGIRIDVGSSPQLASLQTYGRC